MRKKILTALGSTLLIAATVQFATASERHQAHKTTGAPAPMSEQVRNSNAAWRAQPAQPDWSRYSGGFSAPAGR